MSVMSGQRSIQPLEICGNDILDLIRQKNIPNVTLSADENGNAYVDKDEHPDIYDWVVNG